MLGRTDRPAAPGAVPPARPRPSRRTVAIHWWRLLALVVTVVVLVVIGLRGRLPSLPEIAEALAAAQLAWVGMAALWQAVSMLAFALQQWQLLRALGVPVSVRYTVAVTLARSAISISVPAGAAVSAAYALRQYQYVGASRRIAAAGAVVSGLASIGGLTLLYIGGAAGFVVRDPLSSDSWPTLVVVAGLAAVTVVAVLLGRRIPRAAPSKPRTAGGSRLGRSVTRLWRAALGAWQAGAELRPRDWTVAVALALANWLTDLLCLAAATRAVGIPIGLPALAGLYLGIQLVRQVPLTPGGVGLVETALVAGLTAAGATAVTAAAAVLIYRLLSCWLLLPIGGAAAVLLRRGYGRPPSTDYDKIARGGPT